MRQTLFVSLCPALLAAFAMAGQARAIGRDELTPQVDRPADQEEADPNAAETGQAPADAEGKNAKAEKAVKAESAKGAPQGEAVGKGEAKAVEAQTRSATSKALDRKIFVAASLGFANITGGKGTWATRGNADFGLGYDAWHAPSRSLHLFATYRYVPMNVVAKHKDESYRGVVEGHYLGAMARVEKGTAFAWFGQLELGPQYVYLKPTDSFRQDASLEKNAFTVLLGGGADWEVGEKTYIGPRLNVGFGTFTTVQAAANASFLF